MILVTGGTGFVGRVLIRHLIASGKQVRTLLRPSKKSPQLPKGIPVEAAVCSLLDERGLRAALKDVDYIFHLAGTERHSSRADLQNVDVNGSEVLAAVAAQSGVKNIITLSHLGADRSSAYPVLKAKAMTENAIIQSGIPYTILRSAVVYGPGDQFTTSLARLLRMSPGFFMIPGNGNTLLQPIWIEDLVNCLTMCLDNPDLNNRVISIGGLEALSFQQILQVITQQMGIKRMTWKVSPPLMRGLALFMDQFTRFPVSIFWLDYLSADRTTQLDTVPRVFGIIPARFHNQLGYLNSRNKNLSVEVSWDHVE